MKLETTGDGKMTFSKVDVPIRFVNEDGIEFFILETAEGFEFKYAGRWYRANDGKILPMPHEPKPDTDGVLSS